MPYSAIQIARYAISKCYVDKCPISNLQLQKILYYMQGEWLAKNNEVLFKDPICAWKFGPVVPDVYYQYSGYGAAKILEEYKNVELPLEVSLVIDKIIEEKRQLYPWDLVNETHRQGGAWEKSYREGKGERSIIPVDMIRSDFS